MIISKKIDKLFVVALLLLFVVAMLLSFAFMDFIMAANSDGSMSYCPFRMSGSLCNMNFQEHLTLTKLTFTAVPQKVSLIYFLYLAAAFIITLSISQHWVQAYLKFLYSRQLLYAKSTAVSIVIPIQEAFSQGIINPKIFQ